MERELNLDFFKKAGKKGGDATRKKYGKKYLREIAARGGAKRWEKIKGK